MSMPRTANVVRWIDCERLESKDSSFPGFRLSSSGNSSFPGFKLSSNANSSFPGFKLYSNANSSFPGFQLSSSENSPFPGFKLFFVWMFDDIELIDSCMCN